MELLVKTRQLIAEQYWLAPKTRLMIAEEFEMKPRQLTAKILKFQLDIPSGDIMPKHQKMIYEKWGYPTGVNPEWYANVWCLFW